MSHSQTSRMYGIKVKEHVDYTDYEDIRLSYSNETGNWKITSLYYHNWYNGHEYTKNEVIATFADGDDVSYTIMAQHTQEETEEYLNIIYIVTSNITENIQYGNADVHYRILTDKTDPSFYGKVSVYQYENGIIKDTKSFTYEDINKYKEVYGENAKYKVHNLIFKYHGPHPEQGKIPMSFECISDSNYLKYEGRTYDVNFTIKNWGVVSDHSEDFEIIDETNKHQGIGRSKDALPLVQIIIKEGGGKETYTVDHVSVQSDIYHDHKDVYYNGKYHQAMYLVYPKTSVENCWAKTIGAIAITYADPYWFLLCTRDGLERNGVYYNKETLLKSWKYDETVNLEYTFEKSRKRSDPEDGKFDEIVYDVSSSSIDDSVIVSKLINDVQDESITFFPSDAPVAFENLDFREMYGEWTIYSKCGYIKYNSTTYKSGQPIVSFGVNEDLHIQIKDKSNVYMLPEVTKYSIKSENVQAVTYSIWTSEIDKTIKIEKVSNLKPEPWVTVRYYDALYKNYTYDHIILDFDHTTQEWSLISNSNKLYNEGFKYNKGQTIAKWSYFKNISFKHLTVVGESLKGIEVKSISDSYAIEGNDLDEIIMYGENLEAFKICHSSAKGLWQIKAENNYVWYNGINYRTGDVVLEFKDKVVVDQITVMIQIPPVHAGDLPTIVMYNMWSSVDVLNNITTFHIYQVGGSEASFDDKSTNKDEEGNPKGIKTYLLTTESAKSMYGYIWQREIEPGPTPPASSIYLIIAFYNTATAYRSSICELHANSIERNIKRIAVTDSYRSYSLDGSFDIYTILNQECILWTPSIGELPRRAIFNYGEDEKIVIYRENNQTISIVSGVVLKNGTIVFRGVGLDHNLYKAGYTVEVSTDTLIFNLINKESLEYEVSDGYFNNTFIISNNSFVCIKLDEFHTNFNVGFRYFNGEIQSINGNGDSLNAINSLLQSQYGFTRLASSFASPYQADEAILFSCGVGKTRSSFLDVPDDTWFGTVIARYDIFSNSFNYYNKYDIKANYGRVYKFRDKTYMQVTGQWWYWLVPPLTFEYDGDPNCYVYILQSEESYTDLATPFKTYEREVDTSSLFPTIINPEIEVTRLDSDEPLKLRLFDGIPQESVPVTIGPQYGRYSDKLILSLATSGNRRDLIVVMNTHWEESSSNYAWSLDNYGIDDDYN